MGWIRSKSFRSFTLVLSAHGLIVLGVVVGFYEPTALIFTWMIEIVVLNLILLPKALAKFLIQSSGKIKKFPELLRSFFREAYAEVLEYSFF